MVWRKYGLEMEFTGITRKRAAELLAEQFETTAAYSFEGNKYSVADMRGRDWGLLPCPTVQAEKWQNGRMVGANHLYHVKVCTPLLYESDFGTVEEILGRLGAGGAVTNESTGMAVLLNMVGLESIERFKSNLGNIYKSRGTVLQKAVGRRFDGLADCSLLAEKCVICLPLFPSCLNPDDVRSYIQLSQGIADFAAKSKSLQQKENTSPNEKFPLRTWLVRIGFIGEEYKYARKMLTENLDGNSAWLRKFESTSQPEKFETAEVTQEGQPENLDAPVFAPNSRPECPPSPASAGQEAETEEITQDGITM